MRISTLAVFVATPVLANFADQTPLSYDVSSNEYSEHYHFKRPIRKVAIIGAGVGGLISHRELVDAGFEVHSFERDNIPGGNWHYTDEAPVNAAIPNRDIATGDYVPSLPPKGAQFPYVEVYHGAKETAYRSRLHRAPKPIWNTLTSNAPAPIQQIREIPWPVGTAWALPNRKLQGYIRAFASYHNFNSNDNNPNISYNTRVELAEKHHDSNGEEDGWTLTTKTLVSVDRNTVKAIWRKEHFDGLIVATGRYNAPNIPNIAGLKEWADKFPNHIQHSRQYRRPEEFLNQTVLVVGAATSGSEISRDIIQHVKKIYQSVRPETSPIPQRPKADFLKRLPHNVTVVGEIKQFLPVGTAFNKGQIELANGTIITGIDGIIFATGFRYTYPFLPQYHNSKLGVNDTAPVDGVQPIVTDGTHLRSLYLDAFYIPDPTLTFINSNFGMQSFTYAEFVSLAIAKIWSGKADFPSTSELWRRYYALYKERKGYGRHFQFLGAIKTRENLRFFQGWLNDAAVKYGGKQIDGLSKDVDQVNAIWTQARYSTGSESVINSLPSASLSALGIDVAALALNVTVPVTGAEAWAQDAVYDDYW